MHKIDLSKFDLRSDLIIEKDLKNIKNNTYVYNLTKEVSQKGASI